jgi:hypothetical protein
MSKKVTSKDPTKNALECILGQKTVGFYPVIAKALGSVPAAVMVSQGLFWQYKAEHRKVAQIGGEDYFSKTVSEWYEETSITESVQRLARALLVKHGIMKEKLSGAPAKMYFRVDIDSLVAVINGYLLSGVSVAVKHGNKQRQLTRTSSGKFRRQEAVINGNIIIESSESFETTTEREETAAAADILIKSTTEFKDVTLIEGFAVEAKKEKDTPSSAAPLEKEKEPPAARPTPGASAVRRWDAFDIDSAAEEFKENQFSAENFARITGTPAAQMMDRFTAEVDVFVLEQKGKKMQYNRFDEFSSHFFNYARAKVRAGRNAQSTRPNYNQPLDQPSPGTYMPTYS